MSESIKPQIGAYFYPHYIDPQRELRAKELNSYPIPTDFALANRYGIFFPRQYSIDTYGNKSEWNDNENVDILKQLKLLEKSGLNFIAVDSYAGMYRGNTYSELSTPLAIIAEEIQNTNLKFCNVMCLTLPRAQLPIPTPNFQEPNRQFDTNLETLNELIKYSSKYWDNPSYLKINDRPVVYVYGLTSSYFNKLSKTVPLLVMNQVGTWIRAEGNKIKYVDPFIVGVVDTPLMALALKDQGFDLLTTMCGLPNLLETSNIPPEAVDSLSIKNAPLMEDSQQLLLQRAKEWYAFGETIPYLHFIPSITLGWNPRGKAKEPDNTVFRGFPYSPIVHDLKPNEIIQMFNQTISFYLWSLSNLIKIKFSNPTQWRQLKNPLNNVMKSYPPLFTVFAANEITEGACIYPEIREHLDYSAMIAVSHGISLLENVFNQYVSIIDSKIGNILPE